MGKIKFELNRAGVGEVLKSSETMALVSSYGARYTAGLGSGYNYSTFTGFDRAHAYVYASSEKARQDNLEHNTLLKGAGMGD